MLQQAISIARENARLLIPRMPLLGKDYHRNDILQDIIAGATVAAILIPQSMAYALLAGLPPAQGLYAALVGGIAGSLWSNSRYLATGPIAIVGLLTLTAVAPLASVGSSEFIALVAALALMVGVIQIGAGVFRLGFLVRLVPQSVLTGFSSAAAIVIILTQIPHLLGFAVSSGDFALVQLANVARHIFDINIITVGFGVVALLILISLRRISPKFPATLLVLTLGIVLAYSTDIASFGVSLAGDIPAHLPITDVPTLSLGLLVALGAKALVIAFVGFMSSYAILKDMTGKVKERVDPDQELIAQGFANLFAGFFRGFPVGGSLSRTAVNYVAGAATAWSGVFAAGIVALAIVFASPILAYLPKTVLAAIVIFAVLPLVDFANLKRMYQITRTDGIIAFATFATVLLLRPDEAILIGVILALALYMQKVMWAGMVEVGIHPRWNTVHARASFPEVPAYPGVLMLRLDAPLFYANVERLSLDIQTKILSRERESNKKIQLLVLDFSGVNHVDVTGVDVFSELMNTLKEKGVHVYLIFIKREARQTLERAGSLSRVSLLHNVRELKALTETFDKNEPGKMMVF